MSGPYTILALITAGVSLAMGTISFIIGLKRSNKTDLIFGIMSFCLVAFILIPPIGFIQEDKLPYPAIVIIKRIFIFGYYALFPWFILIYTGYPKKQIPGFITTLVIITFSLMLITETDQFKIAWTILALLGFAFILIYGLVASAWQYRNGEKIKAVWLINAMVIFGLLFSFTTIHQLSGLFLRDGSGFFFPIHSHFLSFALIMGLGIVIDVMEKYKLDKRWHLLMKNAEVFVMELDKGGNIAYINSFGLMILGYDTEREVLHKNWFDTFLEHSEAKVVKPLFEKMITKRSPMRLKTLVKSKLKREFTISWVNFFTFTDNKEISGVICVGRDVSNEEFAFKVINQLKAELQQGKD